jgi:hypothetical protein
MKVSINNEANVTLAWRLLFSAVSSQLGIIHLAQASPRSPSSSPPQHIHLILIPVGIRRWRLRSTSLSGDDDLVDREDGASRLGGKPDGPRLGDQQVKDAGVLGIKYSGSIIVLYMSLAYFPGRLGKEVSVPQYQHQ